MWGAGGGFPFGGHFDDEGFGPRAPAAPSGAFKRDFRSYPVSFIDKSELERGDKIVLPPSALDALARLNITFPMLFQLSSRDGKSTHCGVQEFSAEEGHANLPYWLMQNLLVAEGDMITIKNANLPKGTYVKFQPQTSDFLKIANPKAVLEATLRGFTCLTKGDSIAINYNDKIYYIDVLAVAPGEAISIIETDVNVEFAPPPDYVEPEPEKPSATTAAPVKKIGEALGSGDPSTRLKDRLERLKKRVPADANDSDSSDEDKPPPKPTFPGMGQALKLKTGRSGLTFGSSNTSSASASNRKIKDSTDDVDESTNQQEDKKPFIPFGGSGRSLR